MNWIESKIKFRSKGLEFLNDESLEESKKMDLLDKFNDYKKETIENLKNIFYEFGLKELVLQDQETNIEDEFINRNYSFSGAIIGYFIDNRYSDSKKEVLKEKVKSYESKDFNSKYNLETTVNYKKVQDTDWKDNWKNYFSTTKIYDDIVVKPKWEEYTSDNNETIIEIDPEDSFGTGTHPTTVLCIQKLVENSNEKKSMIDIGTGSGILMIVAKKLGIENISGIDIDPQAVKIARRNLELNDIKKGYDLYTGELKRKVKDRKFEIIMANMLSNIILKLIEDIKKLMTKDSIAIFSGILKEEEDVFVSKLEKSGFKILDINYKKEWISVSGRLK